MNKFIVIIIVVLIAFNLGQFIYNSNNEKKWDKILYEKNIENKLRLERSIDSSLINIEKLKLESTIRFDSIKRTPPKIKYVKYEVPTYIYRTFDDAISIHANYKRSTE